MKLKYFLAAIALAAVLPVAAQDTQDEQPKESLKAGDMCPDYVFLDKDSYLVFLSQFSGKFVYIDVWATWCQPCKDQFPALKELKKQFKDDNIVFLGISCDHGWRYRPYWPGAVKQYELEEPQWIISEADGFMDGFQVGSIPRFILIGPDGRVVDENMTRPSDPQTAVRLRELLDAAPEKPAGIDFRDISLEDARAQAAREHRLVFVDAFTEWCGPCRTMNRNILSQSEVYEFMNANFVNLKIDMEKGEGPAVAREYGIDAYPTYLLVHPDGTLQYKFVGMTQSAGEFIDKIKAGMEGETENTGAPEDKTGKEYIGYLLEKGDAAGALEVCQSYLASLTDAQKTSVDCWAIFSNPILTYYGTPAFEYLLANRKTFESNIGNEVVEDRIFDAFDRKLTDILNKRDRTATAQDVAAMKKQINDAGIANAGILTEYAALVEARLAGNADAMMDGLETLAPEWDNDQLNARFFTAANMIAQSGKKSEQKRLATLVDRMLQRSDLTNAARSLEFFRDGVIKKK